ncbi:MAG: DNA repair protein RecO [Nitrospirae bacterium]|nr:DNA repair protein RecO [Nitrospirota bacterium]MBF0536054.1 DNA repair protein RecO [Nitrospirota bacterium]MBF0617942.1 DNA repair protein RecO [Nitrospirota bacterium]
MLLRTEGIVFKSFPLGEADLILTVLSHDGGFLRAFAKSPRTTKSRFGSALEPLSHIRISLMGKEHADLPRLTQADIIHSYQKLREQFDCFLRISELLEITMSLFGEKEHHEGLFQLLVDTLNYIEAEKGSDSLRRFLFYKVRVLEKAGLSPRLQGCARCGVSVGTFYFSEGSVICGKCKDTIADDTRTSGARLISIGAVNLYETIRTWSWDKLNRIMPNDKLIFELDSFLNLHIKYRIERGLKTRDFMYKTKTLATCFVNSDKKGIV